MILVRHQLQACQLSLVNYTPPVISYWGRQKYVDKLELRIQIRIDLGLWIRIRI
jgi:hypothetical protein